MSLRASGVEAVAANAAERKRVLMEGPIRVLLVDDDESIRTLLRFSFQTDQRFQVVGEAYDGRSAMRAMETEKPDVVVLDLMMPNMDGFHALPQINMCSPETKILVLTDADVDEIGMKYKGAHAVRMKSEVLDGYAVTQVAAELCAP